MMVIILLMIDIVLLALLILDRRDILRLREKVNHLGRKESSPNYECSEHDTLDEDQSGKGEDTAPISNSDSEPEWPKETRDC